MTPEQRRQTQMDRLKAECDRRAAEKAGKAKSDESEPLWEFGYTVKTPKRMTGREAAIFYPGPRTATTEER